MRQLLCLLAVSSALFASTASAQFANHSLGLSVGYLDINGPPGIDNGVPVGLEGSLYIESGFDAVARSYFMILNDTLANRQVVGFSLSTGVRYLILEESFRPYVGADISYLHVFGASAGSADFVGLGPSAGLDLFLSESLSIGPRAAVSFYLALNQPVRTSAGIQLVAAAYF